MTTKRLITLVLLGLIASTVVGGSIFFYLRWNSAPNILRRAKLAVRANKLNKAKTLADSYIAAKPDDWQGYFIQAQAYSRQGKYAQARKALLKAGPLKANEPAIVLAHAATYSLPATRALSLENGPPAIKAITGAIASLTEAVKVLRAFEPADDNSAVQINEAIGLDCRILAEAHEAMARRLTAEAEVAEASRSADLAKAKTRASKEARIDADNKSRQAIQMLLDVIRKDPSRERSAEPLVALCIRQKDHKSLAEVKQILKKADNPPPMATMILVTNELMNVADHTSTEFDRKLDEAIKRIDNLRTSHPDDTRLKITRAELAMEKSDTATANKLATELLKVEPRNSQAQLLLARVQMAEGRFAEAEKRLFNLKAEFPYKIAAHYWHALAADATDKEQLAKDAMRTVTRLEALDTDRMLVAKAHKYLANRLLADFPENAYEDARKCHENNPNDPEAVLLLVRAARKTDRLQLARQTLADAAASPDVTARMLMAVFKGYDMLGDRDQAVDALNRAANVKPKNADERYNVARAMLLTHRTSDAMRLTNEAIREDPNSPKIHFVMAMVYEASRRDLQAREHFRKAVELDSRAPEYRIALAASLRKTGELDEALAVLKPVLAISEPAREMELSIKILQAKPDEIAAAAQESGKLLSQLQLAQVYLRKGQVRQCIDLCNTELKKQPDSYAGRMLLGQALLANNEIDGCLEAWTPLIAAKPDELPVYQSLAAALKRQAGPKSLPQEMHDPLAAIPGARADMVNSAIAWLCQKFGKHIEAAGFHEKVAMDAESNQAMHYQARLLQAACLANARQADKALVVLDKLVNDENFKAQLKKTLATKANMLMSLRRLPEAEATLDKLLKTAQAEGDIPYLRSVVESFARIRQMDKALAACDAIQSIRPAESSVYVLRARVLENFNKLEQAGMQYRKAIELNPTDLNIHVNLANNLDARLKPVEAMKALGELKALGQTGRSQALLQEANLCARWGLKNQAIERLEALDEATTHANSPKTNLELCKFMASLRMTGRAKTILVNIPEHAREYVPARVLLAQLADTLEHKLAIIRALADRTPTNPEILAAEIAILLAEGKPDQASKAFTSFMAQPKHKGAIPVAAAVLSITAAIENGDIPLAARTARDLATARVAAQWPPVAAALALDVDPDSAGRLLPKPPQASGLEPVLGLCLAKKTNDPNAARVWTNRLDETLFKTTDGQKSSNQADRYRFLCALLIGDNGRIQPALAKLTARQSVISRAAKELADNLAKNPPRSTDELLTLIQAELAANAQQVDLARLWATKALKARPTCQWAAAMLIQLADKQSVTDTIKAQPPCQWAAALLMQMANQQSQLEKVAALLEPKDCYLARILRARVFNITRQYAESTNVYDSLSEAEKKEPGIAYEHGGVEEKAGNLKKALALYLQAWKNANNPIAANNAAYVIAKLHPKDPNQLEEARKLAEAAREALPFAPHFDTAGWIAYLQGRTDDALRMLRIAVKGMPTSAEVHYHVGLAEAAAGNRGLGRMHLAEAVNIGKELRAADAKLRPSETAAADLAKLSYDEIEPE